MAKAIASFNINAFLEKEKLKVLDKLQWLALQCENCPHYAQEILCAQKTAKWRSFFYCTDDNNVYESRNDD
jgi:hypothetical protein